MKKILFIEDDEILQVLYEGVFTEEGYSVDIAKDGEEGLDKLLNNYYDFISLDIMLPKKDGLQVLEEFKKSKKRQGLIVIVNNLYQHLVITQAEKLGADGFEISSKLTPDDLIQKVKNYLDGIITREESFKQAYKYFDKSVLENKELN